MHVEFLLEEPSSEACLQGLLPKLIADEATWAFHVFGGKRDLLLKLEDRLKGYKNWVPEDWRIVVLIDEDSQDCNALKARLELAANNAGWRTKSTSAGGSFVVLNRIAIEELEAWFFGDVPALVAEYPGVPTTLGNKAKFRSPDAIAGGTWEALERVLQKAGYYHTGLAKIDVARRIGLRLDPAKNRSPSFQMFISGIGAL